MQKNIRKIRKIRKLCYYAGVGNLNPAKKNRKFAQKENQNENRLAEL